MITRRAAGRDTGLTVCCLLNVEESAAQHLVVVDDLEGRRQLPGAQAQPTSGGSELLQRTQLGRSDRNRIDRKCLGPVGSVIGPDRRCAAERYQCNGENPAAAAVVSVHVSPPRECVIIAPRSCVHLFIV